MRIEVSKTVWLEAEAKLRQCGRRGRECVIFMCGTTSKDGSSAVTAAHHPMHLGSAVGYEVPVPELFKLNVWLYEHRLSVILQVHTHPGAAFHSSTDDRWPTIETPGFLSLVVPNFAGLGLADLAGCCLAEYLGRGQWREVNREEMLERLYLEG